MIDGHAAGGGALGELGFELDAAAFDAAVFAEPGEQGPVAAAEVEDAGAFGDEAADEGVVAAAEDLADLHGRASRNSRWQRSRKPRMTSVCSATSTRKASWP